MKTKKTAAPGDPKPLPNPAPDAPSEVIEDISRLSFTVDDKGNPLWDRMRAKTKDQLKQILSDPETAKALGVVQAEAKQPVEVFDPAWTGALFDSVGKLEAFLAAKIYKIPSDIADKAFAYSEAEKAKLAGPAAKVINKYAATWMIQFKDEIALAMLFVTLTAVKLQMAVALSQMRGATDGKTAPAPSRPTAVPRNDPSAEDLDKVEAENYSKMSTMPA